MTAEASTSGSPKPSEEQKPLRVEQDGREVLLVELGAARERVSWLVAQNDRFQEEARQAIVQSEAYAVLAHRAQGQALAWRLAAIVAIGFAAVIAMISYGMATGALIPQ